MSNIEQLSKQLYFELRENEDRYANEELDLNLALQKTDEIYTTLAAEKTNAASSFLMDSNILTLETKIARQSTRAYKINALSFDPRKFSMETRNYFGLGNSLDSPQKRDSMRLKRDSLSELWTKLGECSKEIMYTVPNFNYIYGTFEVDAIETVKKKRKYTPKDKLGEVTKPKQVSINEAKSGEDVMCTDASRILSCFLKLTQKNKKNSVCFYEFVIDPTSFTRTVEYIFLVSLLVQQGLICLFADDQGLPYLKKVESKDSEGWRVTPTQTALSISMEEWESLIKTFGFKTPVIPPKATN